MARGLTTALNNQFIASSLNPFMAVSLDFEGDPINAWVGKGTITFGGVDYFGIGNLLSISPIEETQETKATTCQIALSGIPADLISAALNTNYQGRTGIVYLGALDSSRAVVADPYAIFSGLMDVVSINENQEVHTIGVQLESRLISMQRAKTRRFTKEDQQIDFPDDKGLNNLAKLQDNKIQWGGGET